MKKKKTRAKVKKPLVLRGQLRNTIIMAALSFAMIFGYVYINSRNIGNYTPGTYYGCAAGKEDGLWVEVVVSEKKIEQITVLDNNEYDGISDPAKKLIPELILRYNTPDVDSVSGATLTSNGIRLAVYDALKQANGREEKVQYTGSFPQNKQEETPAEPTDDVQTQ